MSLERLEAKMDDIKCCLEGKIEEVRKILLGNGKIGICAKVQMLWQGKKTRMGLLDWSYRIIIGIGIGYIAMKAGLK